MNKFFLALAIVFTLSSAISIPPPFTGKIQYKYSFSDLEGKDITEKAALVLGREQHYFVSDSNYKSHDESNNITQLYDSRTNTYFGFWKNQTAHRIDALTRTSQKYMIRKLDKTETILGYKCRAIQVETDETSTVYYYSPLLRINPKGFSKHNFGDWNRYLEATDGALSLKYVITNLKKGYVWTIQATKITKMQLGAGDFEFPKMYILRN